MLNHAIVVEPFPFMLADHLNVKSAKVDVRPVIDPLLNWRDILPRNVRMRINATIELSKDTHPLDQEGLLAATVPHLLAREISGSLLCCAFIVIEPLVRTEHAGSLCRDDIGSIGDKAEVGSVHFLQHYPRPFPILLQQSTESQQVS